MPSLVPWGLSNNVSTYGLRKCWAGVISTAQAGTYTKLQSTCFKSQCTKCLCGEKGDTLWDISKRF